MNLRPETQQWTAISALNYLYRIKLLYDLAEAYAMLKKSMKILNLKYATTDVLEKVKIPPTDHLTVRFIPRSRLEKSKKYKICDSLYCTSVLSSPQ